MNTLTNHGAFLTLERIELPPFTLPTPPPGMRWHREDGWTAEDLPHGTRPLCDGEPCEQGDEVILPSQTRWSDIGLAFGAKMTPRHLHTRTTRPLLFTHSGHQWTWHRAGEACPCDGEKVIHVLTTLDGASTPYSANTFAWYRNDTDTPIWWGQIIGWRYAYAEKPDPYAELKKAHAEGKVIQIMTNLGWQDFKDPAFAAEASAYRIKPDEIPWIEWKGGPCPLKDEEVEAWEYKRRNGITRQGGRGWDMPSTRAEIWMHAKCESDITAYRVLKWRTPKSKVPLGPEDVPPFSLIRRKPEQNNGEQWHWRCVSYVHGVGVQCGDRGYKWDELQKDYQINRSIPMTGKWNPDAWEPCEK